MNLVFKDSHFSFELIRTLGYGVYGGADVGECISTAQKIKNTDFESWYAEWHKTAQRIQGIAEDCQNRGHGTSAGEAYLRASNYHRVSEFYLHADKDDIRALSAWKSARDCFLKAVKLLELPVEAIQIPYEGNFLPGYFCKAGEGELPTIIINGGFDSTAEELYFVAAAAMRRGYNCLVFDGPGQGAAVREQKLYFRADWENVITPVVDYLVGRNDVKTDRIVLMGFSFGGYLAPRSAAFEHRICALIANGGIYSYFDSSMSKTTSKAAVLKELAKEKSTIIEFSNRLAMKFITAARWAINDGLWKFNAETTHQLLRKYQQYTLEGAVESITCPTLVCDCENEPFFGDQAKVLFAKLSCPKEYMLFTEEEGAGQHCQSGALLRSHQRIFDWLDELFGRQ